MTNNTHFGGRLYRARLVLHDSVGVIGYVCEGATIRLGFPVTVTRYMQTAGVEPQMTGAPESSTALTLHAELHLFSTWY